MEKLSESREDFEQVDPLNPSIAIPEGRLQNPRKITASPRPERSRRRSGTWEQTHRAHLNSKRGQAFAWGANDCMTFAADAVTAYGYPDPMIDWRGVYATAREAAEILNSKPGGLLDWALEIFKDYPQIRSRSAKRGDVVYLEIENEIPFGTNSARREMMGVCDGAFAVVLAPLGTMTVDMKYARKAWAIGHK